ncbi:S24 family peptidase, partial [Campylobacter gastrosuis]|uniref:S24 family peptidase n=1 Tax=Campylobacter gastrosuis TaxID=2974576 RepID=UPI003D76CAA8
ISTIKKYEAGSVENFTYENLKKISSAFNVTPSDFLDEFLSANLSDNPLNLKKSQVEQIKNDQIYIRQLSSAVGAGESVDIEGIEIYDTDILVPFSAMLFKVRPQNTNNIRCMRVDGYSMIPMLYPDSWVIADVTARFSGDGLYIINFCGSFMVKLLQKAPNGTLYIKSVNKDYQSYEIGPDDQTEVYIVGKVLRCVI